MHVMYDLGNVGGVLQDEFLKFVDMSTSYLGWVLKGVVGTQMLQYLTLAPDISRPGPLR